MKSTLLFIPVCLAFILAAPLAMAGGSSCCPISGAEKEKEAKADCDDAKAADCGTEGTKKQGEGTASGEKKEAAPEKPAA